MNELNEWWVVAESGEVKRAPMGRVVCGTPLVVFRDSSGNAAALLDRCPHRHATLSAGKISGDVLMCGYHGWRFNRMGVCVAMPGIETVPPTQPIVASFAVREALGLLWVFPGAAPENAKCFPPIVEDGHADRFVIAGQIESTLDQASENFLDASHTHFVHAGLVRQDKDRQQVRAKIRRIERGVEVEYSNEAPQSGLISRLFESERICSFGRFTLPGIAEIEYRGKTGMTLRVTALLTPVSTGVLSVHAVVATRRGLIPAAFKRAVLRPIFERVFEQDREVLSNQLRNRGRHKEAEYLDSPMDLLGPLIRRLLKGETLPADVEREQELLL